MAMDVDFDAVPIDEGQTHSVLFEEPKMVTHVDAAVLRRIQQVLPISHLGVGRTKVLSEHSLPMNEASQGLQQFGVLLLATRNR